MNEFPGLSPRAASRTPVRGGEGRVTASAGRPGSTAARPLDEVERYGAEKALGLTGGIREEAANLLGIGERTLYRKLQERKKVDEKTGL